MIGVPPSPPTTKTKTKTEFSLIPAYIKRASSRSRSPSRSQPRIHHHHHHHAGKSRQNTNTSTSISISIRISTGTSINATKKKKKNKNKNKNKNRKKAVSGGRPYIMVHTRILQHMEVAVPPGQLPPQAPSEGYEDRPLPSPPLKEFKRKPVPLPQSSNDQCAASTTNNSNNPYLDSTISSSLCLPDRRYSVDSNISLPPSTTENQPIQEMVQVTSSPPLLSFAFAGTQAKIMRVRSHGMMATEQPPLQIRTQDLGYFPRSNIHISSSFLDDASSSMYSDEEAADSISHQAMLASEPARTLSLFDAWEAVNPRENRSRHSCSPDALLYPSWVPASPVPPHIEPLCLDRTRQYRHSDSAVDAPWSRSPANSSPSPSPSPGDSLHHFETIPARRSNYNDFSAVGARDLYHATATQIAFSTQALPRPCPSPPYPSYPPPPASSLGTEMFPSTAAIAPKSEWEYSPQTPCPPQTQGIGFGLGKGKADGEGGGKRGRYSGAFSKVFCRRSSGEQRLSWRRSSSGYGSRGAAGFRSYSGSSFGGRDGDGDANAMPGVNVSIPAATAAGLRRASGPDTPFPGRDSGGGGGGGGVLQKTQEQWQGFVAQARKTAGVMIMSKEERRREALKGKIRVIPEGGPVV